MSDELWGDPAESGPSDWVLPGDDELAKQLGAAEPQAEAAAADPDPAPAAEAETAAEEKSERTRDERGRFAKADQPDALPGETPEQTEARLYAGQYKTVEELERAALEKQAFIDRQANELGQERAARERYEQMLAQQQQAAQAGTIDWQAEIDENPAQAARLAQQHQNPHAFQAALRAWEELAPGTPEVWLRQQSYEARMAQAAEQQNRQQWNETMAAFGREHPDFAEFSDGEVTEAFRRNPYALELLQRAMTDPAAQMAALRTVYLDVKEARGRNADTLVAAAQDIARVQHEETQRAKDEAILASATASVATPPKPSRADVIGAEWEAMDKRLDDGWNI